MELINGFLNFLESVNKRNIRTALVSSTSLHSLRLIDEMYHISDLFDLVITGLDTEMHKPHPAPYLKAIERLPADRDNTIVIEDSPNGIISAKAAGCFVYGLTSSFKRDALKQAGADEVIDTYEELAEIIKL